MSSPTETASAREPDGGPAHALLLSNDMSELRRASAWLHAYAKSNALASEISFGLDVCMNEAIANIISHGYGDSAKAHVIELRIWRTGDCVRLQIEDDGRPFNPVQAKTPPPPQTLEAARLGGMGITLLRDTVDGIQYSRRNGRNVLILTACPETP